MKAIYFLIFLLPSGLYAQNTKLNIDLFRLWQEGGTQNVELIVQGEPQAIKELAQQTDSQYKYGLNDLAALSIPLQKLPIWWEHPAILGLQAQRLSPQYFFEQDSLMLANNNARAAHEGWGLPQSFKGQGVLVGIIDDGYEWQHPDFWQPNDSSSRFLSIWDQDYFSPNFFMGQYGYGSYWNKAQIDSGLIAHPPGEHGSHVLGTAAGNGLAAQKYKGIAPKAELLAVALSEDGQFLPRFVDAVHHIFQEAKRLGKACAINSSVGAYYGSHDGQDLYTAMIEAMLEEENGRALIQAGGNARQAKMHWQKAQADSGCLAFLPLNGQLFRSSAFIDSSDWPQLHWQFELKGSQGQRLVLSRPFSPADLPPHSPLPAQRIDTIYIGPQGALILVQYLAEWQGCLEWSFQLQGNNLQNQQLFLHWSGAGKVDIWSHERNMGLSDIILQANVPHYIAPDNQQTLAAYWTCSPKVITVAAYQNRDQLQNYAGDTVSLAYAGFPIFGIADFSSLGPSRTGLQKPDLTAPGGQVLSAGSLAALQNARANNSPYLDQGGWHVSAKGTSMAAPMVTGAAALYFQCQPQANWAELKAALLQSARKDAWVYSAGAPPNIDWGAGKLDVQALLQNCLKPGCLDSNALNFMPNAWVEDGSCYYPSSTNYLAEQGPTLWPNPFNGQLQIELPQAGQLCFYNVLGQEMARYILPAGPKTISTEDWPKGSYIWRWEDGPSGKLIKQ
ncbi:subtilisin-like serine protease [Saprospira grandis DSM 2844]|uniref:Subtilisin-like serine protease n=1 Tax=Saprospira grandis DSM 2844 TaxID=694433 RepID=J1I1X6_9BACT|nr:S8 family serine peptidase [Saprospira grandis]EJF52665.1 subtilisin-like serine protease [Saprospira grandis DSM 2844]